MAEENHPIHIPAESELGKRIRKSMASSEPIRIESGGQKYIIEVTELLSEIKRRPSPERVARSIAGTLAAAGTWKGIDAEEFKDYIRERRRSSTRLPVEL